MANVSSQITHTYIQQQSRQVDGKTWIHGPLTRTRPKRCETTDERRVVSTTPRSSGTKRRWPRVVRDIRLTRMATSVSDRSTGPWIDASEPLIATTVSAPATDHWGANLSFTRSLRVSQDLSGSLTISQDLSQSLTVSHGRRCRRTGSMDARVGRHARAVLQNPQQQHKYKYKYAMANVSSQITHTYIQQQSRHVDGKTWIHGPLTRTRPKRCETTDERGVRLDHATFFWNKTTMATSGPRHSADTHGDQRL